MDRAVRAEGRGFSVLLDAQRELEAKLLAAAKRSTEYLAGFCDDYSEVSNRLRSALLAEVG